ncbi:unnamed protein product (macronuclear) [Paramecium tetraurelia]|uniref:Uncharacterized protein n=1 Tax=Paramecium tetraurelia TaxID=5888 RepID=A0EAN9_PARTE|nr:uncharacterized protein GSPATT00025090001 [Paramecium tetraurelia]CAK92356.1 unnamed protein product [Paramecium tetraurelia]|eukprot:XP_001459753.1 hypothetical protein (macronuclear) [Paramecium tetraurelia strain d4-2]
MLYATNSLYYRQFLTTTGKKSKAQYQPQQQQTIAKGQNAEHPAAQSA